MKRKNATRSALVTSILALLVCVSMLVGATFAWFTDSVASGLNTIAAGNLDVELYHSDKDDSGYVDASTELFNDVTLWEPGVVVYENFKVENVGTLALKYQLSINFENETKVTVDGVEHGLSEVLKVAVVENGFTGGRAEAQNLTFDKSLSTFTLTGELEGNTTSKTYGIVIYWAPNSNDVDNIFNMNNANKGKTLSIDLGINLQAIQEMYESDSFGPDYDEDAEYPATADTWDGTADTSWYNDTDTEFVLTTAEQLAGLAELVDAGNNFFGKTVKLGANIDLNKFPFNPIGHSSDGKSFNGTFDGQGHTISNLYEQSDLNAWQYEGEYYGLFAYTNGATIKNVTVADAYISSGRNEAAAVVGNAVDTTFTDITVSNTTLIAYNNSAGGVASECYGNCSFTNITVDEDTVIGPLWGTYDVRLGGVVGLVHAGNNVTFSNITVACQLDAINDVAANYQYWLYRYCGMLIGQVDGVNGVADPTGYVTCENVTVNYGDWVNYHYCEYASLGAGSYNGPGEYKYARVEAGTGTDGIDLSTCNHNEDESHNVLIVFDQLFGGGQGVSGLKTYDGVTVNYNN